MTKAQSLLKRYPYILVISFMLLGVSLKIILLATNRMPFNSDEAIVGLMASHILEGDIPVFFWGQSYMGSLDALLVAGAFLLIGKSVLAIRIVQILLFCGIVLTTYHVGRKMFNNNVAGWMAALLIAIPTVNVTLYTTISLGGYGEALLLGNLIILAGLRIPSKNNLNDWFKLGLLSGLGLWVNGLTLVYSIPVVCISLWRLLKRFGKKPEYKITARVIILVAACILGSIPWWIYGVQYGYQSLVKELLGGAITNSEIGYFQGVWIHLVSFILFGITVIFGFRPSWEIRWLVLPMIPLVMVIWAMVFINFRKLWKANSTLSNPGMILIGIILTLTFGFILTSFGNDPSGRYFLPLWVTLAAIAGGCLSLSIPLYNWRWGILFLLVAFNLGGIIQCWLKTPPGFTTQFDASTIYDHEKYGALISFLERNHIYRGYSTYWIAYPLAFMTNEEIIFIPRLPYHDDFGYTDRDDRYLEYDDMVKDSTNIGYITAKQPWLDKYIRDHFDATGLKWQENVIGDFRIFYKLSQPVTPKEIGLGESTESD